MSEKKATKSEAGSIGGRTVLEQYGLAHFSEIGKLGIKAMREGRNPNALQGGALWVPGRYRQWLMDLLMGSTAGEERTFFIDHLNRFKLTRDRR